MKQVLNKQGQIVVETVASPSVQPGSVLIRVQHSCISAGTEMAGITAVSDPLWLRALKKPEAVKNVIKMAATQGITHTKNVVEGKLAEGYSLGYSVAGTVIETGEGVNDLKPGDRVAASGAQCAFHAEMVCVPRNLVTSVPDELDLSEASTVTLGAIALQGIRRANPTLGEHIVVMGLGLLGQLTVQMLKANGCRVTGVEPVADRLKQAKELGLDHAVTTDEDVVEQIRRLTDGQGADGVIVTAHSHSDDLLSDAFKMCRRKGRVVLVGSVGMNVRREDIYVKELDFFISTSYGPGRYDRQYEEKGLDYPIAYVRWTENRNMQEYLNLIAQGKVQVSPMIQATFPVDEAPKAYESLKDEASKPLIVLLSYPEIPGETAEIQRVIQPASPVAKPGVIQIALIGAGGFLKGMHLPNLTQLKSRYQVRAVASRNGNNASNTALQAGANYSTTDYQEILQDKEVHAVLIATPHITHGEMVLQALSAGKHVLVEKPLTLNPEDVDRIADFYASAGETPPILLTGFNRRFSPHNQKLKALLENRTNPAIINYRMNAGHIPLDHPLHHEEGGGRNLGEACHIYDLFTYLTESTVTEVSTHSLTPTTAYYSHRDNFTATMSFADGSIASLTYTSLGNKEYPKERMEVFSDGKVFTMDDYKVLTIQGLSGQDIETRTVNKGHLKELELFADCIQKGKEWPNPLWQQLQATQIAFMVESDLEG